MNTQCIPIYWYDQASSWRGSVEYITKLSAYRKASEAIVGIIYIYYKS